MMQNRKKNFRFSGTLNDNEYVLLLKENLSQSKINEILRYCDIEDKNLKWDLRIKMQVRAFTI